MTYVVRGAFSIYRNEWRAASTLALRALCRKLLPRRLSARCRYRQIGSNSFRVELFGVAIIHAYKATA